MVFGNDFFANDLCHISAKFEIYFYLLYEQLVDGVNDVLTKFEYVLTPIDPIAWKDTKKKAIPAVRTT